jgi:cytoskeletal protein CcmA (bactofilin family)
MALWKDSNSPGSPSSPLPPPLAAAPPPPAPVREPEKLTNVAALNPEPPRKPKERPEVKESIIASGLTIEGKIEGSGSVRMSGRFKGDVNVDGNLTIDAGAHLSGQVRAGVVIVGGELEGNIVTAKRVEVLETAVITGDVKAGTIQVAAGARMRGQMEFGWEDKASLGKPEIKGYGSAP